MTNKDGGWAFPSTPDADAGGMVLRDYFAAKAMPTLLSQFYAIAEKEGRGFDDIYKIASEASYEIADAMIAAR
ncbi:MAG: hypothetical protein [Bacteriophage sp.]|nr:MAG: hypothetical protein [Bacteriophage sp.]